jgi:acetyl esterase/lipase
LTIDTVKQARLARRNEYSTYFNGELYAKFDRLVDVKEVTVGGHNFHPKAMMVKAYVHQVKRHLEDKTSRPCMIYFHGGGGVLGSAEANKTHCNRYAVEGDCTVINVDYRLAPENKAPAGSCDSYAALKCIISDYESF